MCVCECVSVWCVFVVCVSSCACVFLCPLSVRARLRQINAFFRPHKNDSGAQSPVRQAWELAHKNLGRGGGECSPQRLGLVIRCDCFHVCALVRACVCVCARARVCACTFVRACVRLCVRARGRARVSLCACLCAC